MRVALIRVMSIATVFLTSSESLILLVPLGVLAVKVMAYNPVSPAW